MLQQHFFHGSPSPCVLSNLFSEFSLKSEPASSRTSKDALFFLKSVLYPSLSPVLQRDFKQETAARMLSGRRWFLAPRRGGLDGPTCQISWIVATADVSQNLRGQIAKLETRETCSGICTGSVKTVHLDVVHSILLVMNTIPEKILFYKKMNSQICGKLPVAVIRAPVAVARYPESGFGVWTRVVGHLYVITVLISVVTLAVFGLPGRT